MKTTKQTPHLIVIDGGQTDAPRLPWSSEATDLAREAGFFWTGGRIAGGLAQHVKRDGWDWVKKVWKAYLASRPFLNWDLAAAAGRAQGEPVRDIRFVSPQDFSNNYGFWDLRITPQHLKPIKQQQHLTGDLSTPPERPAA